MLWLGRLLAVVKKDALAAKRMKLWPFEPHEIVASFEEVALALQSFIRRHGVMALRGAGLEEAISRIARLLNLRVR